MKKLIPFIILLFTFSGSQHVTSQPISRNHAIEDVWYLKSTLEATHPNLYYRLPENEFKQQLNSVIDKCGEQVAVDSLRVWLTPVVNRLLDGHTRIEHRRKQLTQSVKYFPLKLNLSNNVVVQNNSTAVPAGAVVRSINGRPLNVITNELISYINAEKRYNQLAELEYTLPYWLQAVYGWQELFQIHYLHNGNVHTTTVNGRTEANFFEVYPGNVKGTFKMLHHGSDQYGYLQLSLFGNSRSYYQLVDQCFEALQAADVQKLIIDIRDNPGGDTSLADYLFQYISPGSYSLYEQTSINYSKLSRRYYRNYGWRKPYLLPFLITMAPYWKAKGEKSEAARLMSVYFKDEKRFRGEVYLVTSHYCYSAADDFARVFKRYNMGTVVGQETGGMKESYGDVLVFKLPHSKIECGCSYKFYKGHDLGDAPNDGVKRDVSHNCAFYSTQEVVELVHGVCTETVMQP